jgi:hypothetical protein
MYLAPQQVVAPELEDEAEQKAVAPLLVMVAQVTHGLQEMV